ncbi:hypothetical protein [Noviherbaspirillum sp. L7-7A]|nr:hypothetical protein [Noviherbaspirillum sp. L7-7A]
MQSMKPDMEQGGLIAVLPGAFQCRTQERAAAPPVESGIAP